MGQEERKYLGKEMYKAGVWAFLFWKITSVVDETTVTKSNVLK